MCEATERTFSFHCTSDSYWQFGAYVQRQLGPLTETRLFTLQLTGDKYQTADIFSRFNANILRLLFSMTVQH